MMAFLYYEVRPVIEENGTCNAYESEAEFHEAVHALNSNGDGCEAFWSIYGRYDDSTGALLAQCVGDFATKEAALEVLNAILGTAATARDQLDAGSASFVHISDLLRRIVLASATLDDVINQSSSHERL